MVMTEKELERYRKGDVYDGTVSHEIKEKVNNLNRQGFNRLEGVENYKTIGHVTYFKDNDKFNKILDKDLVDSQFVVYNNAESELDYLEYIQEEDSKTQFLGVHDIDEVLFSKSKMSKYTDTSYRFSNDIVTEDGLFISSDWFTPIAVSFRGTIHYIPTKVFGEDKFYSIREYIQYRYNTKVELEYMNLNEGVLVFYVKQEK